MCGGDVGILGRRRTKVGEGRGGKALETGEGDQNFGTPVVWNIVVCAVIHVYGRSASHSPRPTVDGEGVVGALDFTLV